MYRFVLVFMFLNKIQAEPFILKPIGTCQSPYGKHGPFPRQTYSTSSDNYELFINLCDALPERHCGRNANVCIKSKENGSLVLAGNAFVKNGSDTLNVNISDSSLCKEATVSVKFGCSYDLIERPNLYKSGNCNFEIQLLDPRSSCNLPCTVRVDNNLINLMPLSKVYRGRAESFNYSVGLCTASNNDCGSDEITSCIFMKDGENKPLSEGLQVITYENDKNEIKATGHRGGSKALKLSIILKCNWDKKTPELSYPKIPTQGKKFKFILESSYGCIKSPSPCIYTFPFSNNHKYNIYNFTSLSRPNYWTVTHPGGSIFFNICGKLTLPNREGCSDYAQVCEKNATSFINRGSLQSSKLSDELYMTFTDGDICNNQSQRYETIIRFKCGPDSEPKFNKTEDCVTTLDWTTTAACPKQDESKCDVSRKSQNCTFEYDNLLYNFTRLVRKPEDGYILKNLQDPNVEFWLNLCEHVTDPQVPCLKNSMATMKYLDQFDVTNRVVSLGEFREFKALSRNVSIIKTSGGKLSQSSDSTGSYESIITLECSALEEGPKYTNMSGYTVHFQWKTPAACPTKIKTDQCIVGDSFSDTRFNLTDVKDKSIRVNVSDISYIFDICDSYTADCSRQKSCEYVPLHNLITIANKHYLEFNLSRGCNGDGDFNRTLIELACGRLTNNDHFILRRLANCVLRLELQSTLICTKEELSYVFNDHVQRNKIMPKTVISTSYKRNCSVVNNSTGYSFNIDQLNLNIPSHTCPKMDFKRLYGVTELSFMTDNVCRQSQNWTYLVRLKCPTNTQQDVEAVKICQKNFSREGSEFCKLIELPEETNYTSYTLSIVVPVLLILLCIGLFALYKYKRSPACADMSGRHLLFNRYEKEADL